MKLIFVTIPVFILKLLLVAVIISTPVLGFWLASSMAAYLNGPTWLAFVAGLLLFPVLPLIWESYSSFKWRKRDEQKPRSFMLWTRLTMRTLLLSLVFIGGFLVWQTETAFLALSTRGDWMLESRSVRSRLDRDQRDYVRGIVFGTANRLEGLYELFHTNPYDEMIYNEQARSIKPRPSARDQDLDEGTIDQFTGLWPWSETVLHDAVRTMPRSIESSIESVATYLAEQEQDPFLRIKALHDYVADRVSYDTNALRSGEFPPQDAETVFRTGKSVCAGYANLLAALGKACGEEILIISGDARGQDSGLSGIGHAWNVVRIEDTWYLLDATWDSGYVNNFKYTREYKTDYLFTPPGIMAITHFPDDPDWQLMSEPLTRGDFLRQPWIKPRFYAQGMKLIEPDRSQSDVAKEATIKIDNPRNRWLMAKYARKGSQPDHDCTVAQTTETCITCRFPTKGTYEVSLYSSPDRYGTYNFVGKIEFNRRL